MPKIAVRIIYVAIAIGRASIAELALLGRKPFKCRRTVKQPSPGLDPVGDATPPEAPWLTNPGSLRPRPALLTIR